MKGNGSVIRITLFFLDSISLKLAGWFFCQSFDHIVHWNSVFERKRSKKNYACKKNRTYKFLERCCRDKWDEQNWFYSCYELFVRRSFAFWNFCADLSSHWHIGIWHENQNVRKRIPMRTNTRSISEKNERKIFDSTNKFV